MTLDRHFLKIVRIIKLLYITGGCDLVAFAREIGNEVCHFLTVYEPRGDDGREAGVTRLRIENSELDKLIAYLQGAYPQHLVSQHAQLASWWMTEDVVEYILVRALEEGRNLPYRMSESAASGASSSELPDGEFFLSRYKNRCCRVRFFD